MKDVQSIRKNTADAMREAGVSDFSPDYIDQDLLDDLMDNETVEADWAPDTRNPDLPEEDELEPMRGPSGGSHPSVGFIANEPARSRHVRYVWRPAKAGNIWHFYWYRGGQCTALRGSGAVHSITDSGSTCANSGEKIYKIVWYTG